jgi:hypothetical protein
MITELTTHLRVRIGKPSLVDKNETYLLIWRAPLQRAFMKTEIARKLKARRSNGGASIV